MNSINLKFAYGFLLKIPVILLLMLFTSLGASGQSGSTLKFTGTEHVNVPNHLELQTLTFSIEAWFRIDQKAGTDFYVIINRQTSAVERNYWLAVNHENPAYDIGAVVFNVGDGTASLVELSSGAGFDYRDGNWHHVSATVNRTNGDAALHVNGMKVDDVTFTGNPWGGAADITIGSQSDLAADRFFSGNIDEIRIWNSVKTEVATRADMCRTHSGNEPNLRAYWNFDDGSGSTLTDQTSNASSNHHGTLQNNPDWVTSGAPLGDVVVHEYPGTGNWSTFIITDQHQNGDRMRVKNVSSTTTDPVGIHLIRVNKTPNDQTTNDPNIQTISQLRYWIVYIVGGENFEYDIDYEFGDHPGWTEADDLTLVKRVDNAAGQWIATGASTPGNLLLFGEVSRQQEFILATVHANDPLPVELVSFDVHYSRGVVNLEWETASEINNSHFLIQRRTENSNWETIGREKGHGDTWDSRSYTFRDYRPEAGYNYYRLKQVDFDGAYEYSPIRYVMTERPELYDITVYPNPSSDGDLKLSFSISESTNVGYELLSIQGRVINTEMQFIEAGNHEWDLSDAYRSVEPGMYLLKTLTDRGTDSFILIKSK